MAEYDKSEAHRSIARKAGEAVNELRETIGLPIAGVGESVGARIAELSRDKGVLVEWDVRVLRRGETVEAVCNCHCYA
jgi:hypothetical protein